MPHPKSELYFLLTLLFVVFVIASLIFEPFLYALILALVFTTVFGPLHKKILTLVRGNQGLAALLATITVLVVVITPLTILGVQIFQEANQLYDFISQNRETPKFSNFIDGIKNNMAIFSYLPISSFDVSQYLKQSLSWLLQHLGPLFANIARVIIGIFIFLISLYYLFKDSDKLKKAIIALSPLQDKHDETIFNKLALAINSVIKGNLAVALIQGILTAIGLAIFGIPNATLWGSVATITALIPGLGTTLVLVPAILYLLLTEKIVFAIGLLIWGVVIVGLADNILRPKLVEQGMQLHPFLILLSIFGGLNFFGPLGFLLGPLVLSLLFTLLEIYSTVKREHIA